MKTLKFKFDLNCKFAVYVPSTINVNEISSNDEVLNQVLRRMSTLFGGATTTPAKGAWVCEDGSTIVEAVDIVYSFCTSEQAINHFNDVLEVCEYIKKEMNQEAVTLEYNGQVKFI